jgi:hypothetical protein
MLSFHLADAVCSQRSVAHLALASSVTIRHRLVDIYGFNVLEQPLPPPAQLREAPHVFLLTFSPLLLLKIINRRQM